MRLGAVPTDDVPWRHGTGIVIAQDRRGKTMALSPSDEIALSHQFRTLADSETSPLAGAPLGDLVTGSLRLGRRRRRNRMLAQVAAATAAASVMVAALDEDRRDPPNSPQHHLDTVPTLLRALGR